MRLPESAPCSFATAASNVTTGLNKPIVPISVIIPAFQAERFLQRTLDSVRSQTVSPSEIIVVDDGSHDRTQQIALAAGARVLHSPRIGTAGARNTGILHAVNDWIALLDHDDVWQANKLQFQWDLVNNNSDLDVVLSDYDCVLDDLLTILERDRTRGLVKYSQMIEKRLSHIAVELNNNALAVELPHYDFFLPSTAIFRRALLLKVNGFRQIGTSEDFDFILRCLPHATIAMIELPLLAYVKHSTALTSTTSRDDSQMAVYDAVLSEPGLYDSRTVQQVRTRRAASKVKQSATLLKQRRILHSLNVALRSGIEKVSLVDIFTMAVRYAAKKHIVNEVLRHFSPLANIIEETPGQRLRSAVSLPQIEIPWRRLPCVSAAADES